jgi:DNA-binding CsgD family transcriptional regulator
VPDATIGLVGRAAERAELEAFVDGVASGPATLELEAEAGMGKTTLWAWAVALARERGWRVLAAQPVEAEVRLPFAVLGDLLGDVVDQVSEDLPPPQAEALRVALLLEPARSPLQERSVGVSVMSALRALTSTGPVLLAVDDMQCSDAASAAVLSFAWRRLSSEPVGVLLARRLGEPVPPALDGLGPIRRLAVGPLDVGELHRLLRGRAGKVFALPVLRRIHAASGGNPLYALEIARAFDLQSADLAEGLLPRLPESLAELVAGRIAALPEVTRELLVAIAALAHPTLGLARTLPGGEEALRPAFAARILELEGQRVRFSHPLLAAAAQEAADPVRRRALYRRLAAVVADEDERARLLAIATDDPDEEVASALERAAARAVARGATAAAAELCERARRLTPPAAADGRDRRALAAARYHWAAADTERARAVLEEMSGGGASGEARAEALCELAWIHLFRAEQPEGLGLARRALDGLDSDTRARGHAVNCVASALGFMLEDLDEAARLWAEAAELARRRGDLRSVCENLCGVACVASLRGDPDADAVLQEAEDLGPEAWGLRLIGWPSMQRAGGAQWTDRQDEAILLFQRLGRQAGETGDEGSLPAVLTHLALAQFVTGRWADAETSAAEGYEAAVQAGERQHEAIALSARALVRACTGRAAEARTHAERALEIAGERSVALARVHAQWALALVDLAIENPGDAAARLGPLRAQLVAGGVGEPGALLFAGDEIEALVAAGRLEAAAEAADWLEARGLALDRASALAGALRGRGLLAAAAGDQGAAIDAFEDAVAQHGRVTMPFARACTLLHLGAAQRRAKRRREARATLSEARDAFDALGAVPWSRRACEELARVSGRRPGGSDLTATEQLVAELVAEGRTNKEVAAALFLSPRTVESNLTRVFVKLGVRSRTELAAKVQGSHRFGRAAADVASAHDVDPAKPHS